MRFSERNPADADLLAIDIGNTSIALGAVVGGNVTHTRTVDPAQPDDLASSLITLWSALTTDAAKRIVVGSVVPETLSVVRDEGIRRLGQQALVVSEEISLPMPVAVAEPARVGVDRVCCAAAAYEVLRSACVVADFGTAVTIDLVSDDGVFMGGTISPGLAMSVHALHDHTAALPLVELHVPDDPVGTNTEAAIRAGVVYCAVGVLREVTMRFAEKIGKWPMLVLTGGEAALVTDQADFVDRLVPDLCLRGLALAYRLEAAPPDVP